MPGHGTSGVKAWLAVILMDRRLGPGRPTAAHDSVHDIRVPSSHPQLCGKLAGKLSAGAKLIALCIEFRMPVVSIGRPLAYSAPMRVVPASAADLVASMPKSAIPAPINARIGATRANSAATLPSHRSQPPGHRRRCPPRTLDLVSGFIRRARRYRQPEGCRARRSRTHRSPGSQLRRPSAWRQSTAGIWGHWDRDCRETPSTSSGNR